MATKKDKSGAQDVVVGTVLFREGEQGDKLYVVKSGLVRITKKVQNNAVIVEEVGPGEFCGELVLVHDGPRTTSAVVARDGSVIAVDAKEFESMVQGNSEIAMRMLRKLSQRLARAQYRQTNLSLRSAKGRLLHQLYHEVKHSEDFKTLGFAQSRPLPQNLPEALLLEIKDIKDIISEFVRNEFISVDAQGYFQVKDFEAVERYLSYLELHDRYESFV